MSQLDVDTVQAKTTNGDLTLQGNGTGVPDLASGTKLNGTALTDTFSTQSPVGANIIINGHMAVAQRGTSFAAVTNNQDTLDRWRYVTSGTTGVVTISQDTDVPTGVDVYNSLKIDVTTADASVAAGDLAYLQYRVEGNDIAHAQLGTANAKNLTLSFYLKSDTKTGTMCIGLYDGPDAYMYPHEITIADNNWNRYEFTFTATNAVGGTFNKNNSNGLGIILSLISGSTYQDGTNDTWAATAFATTANQDNFLDNTANNIFLTGVKLEVGSTATAFVPDDYGTALAKCQRYYWRSADINNNLVVNETQGTAHNASLARPEIVLSVPMRTKPTFALSPAYSSGWKIHQVSGNFATTNGGGVIGSTPNNGSKYVIQIGMSGGVAYRQSYLYNTTGSVGYYELDAEL